MSDPAATPKPPGGVAVSAVVRRSIPAAIVAAGAAWMLYLATAAPCAWWGDGQELACAAWTLGVPHPTGYPLYTFVAHLWMHALGWIDPGRALTLFSAVCTAVAVGILAIVFGGVVKAQRAAAGRAHALGWTLAATLTIALSRTVWEHATFAEVYPMTFLLGCALVGVGWFAESGSPTLRGPVAIGALGGLLALHHYSGAAFAPFAVLVLVALARRTPHPARAVVVTLGIFILCLSGYGATILLARGNPPLNWGDPSNLERLRWVLSGGQFTQVSVGGGAMAGLARWLDWWGCQWLPGGLGRPAAEAARPWIAALGVLPLGFALAGLALLARRRPAVGWGLIASIAMTALFAAVYHIVDIDPYFLPALPAAGIGWIVAGEASAARLGDRLPRPALLLWLASALLGLLALANWPWIDKRGDDAPLVWGRTAIETVDEGALIVTMADNDIFSLWYQQMVFGRRPDVTVLGSNFIFSGWYRRYFERPERPKIPLRVEEGGIALGKLPFDVALIGGSILPNMRERRAVYSTFRDPTIDEYFAPQLTTPLLDPQYAIWFNSRYLNTLPPPALWRLQPNEGMMALDEAGLRRELETFHRRMQTAVRGGGWSPLPMPGGADANR
jgi:hypothetical protein